MPLFARVSNVFSFSPRISRFVIFGGSVSLLVVIIVMIYFFQRSELDVPDQIISDSIFIEKVMIGYPQGGYIVIYAGSGIPGEGIGVTKTTHLDAGTYTKFVIPITKIHIKEVAEALKPGDFYAFLYADRDGLPGSTPVSLDMSDEKKDVLLRDLFGRYLIKRFRLE